MSSKRQARVNIAGNRFFVKEASDGFVLGPISEQLKRGRDDHGTVCYDEQGRVVNVHWKVDGAMRWSHSPEYFLESVTHLAYRAVYEVSPNEIKRLDGQFIAIPFSHFYYMRILLEPILRLCRVFKVETRKTSSGIVEKRFRINFRALIFAALIISVPLRIAGTVLLAIPIRARAKLVWKLFRLISVKPSELTPATHFPAMLLGLGYQGAFLFHLKERNTILISELKTKEERQMLLQRLLKEIELEKLAEPPISMPDVLLEVNIKDHV